MAGVGVLELPIRWAKHQPVTSREAGIILATYGFAYGIMQIPGGVVTRRLGSVRTLRLALFVAALSWPLSLVHAWWLVAVGRGIYGAAVALTFPAGLLLLRERVDERQLPGATAGFASFWAVGMAMVALVGWSEVITGAMIGATLVLGMLLLSFQPVAPAGGDLRSVDWSAVRTTLGQPAVRILLVALPGAVFSQQAIFAWGPRVGGGGAAASIVTVGLLIAIALSSGTWIGRLLTVVLPGPLIVSLCPIVTGLFVIAFAFVQNDPVARMITITGVVFASVLSWTPGLVRVLRDTPPHLQPLATSIINELAWVISSLSPLLLGLSATGVSELPAQAAWIGVGLVSITAGAVTYVIDVVDRRGLAAAKETF
jgi:MFS family permease